MASYDGTSEENQAAILYKERTGTDYRKVYHSVFATMTAKQELINFLQIQKYSGKDWIAGGTLERYMADISSYKPSNVSRRLRELENDGFIERDLTKGFVRYRIKEVPPSRSVEEVRVHGFQKVQ